MEILETFPRVFCFPKSHINENGDKSTLHLNLSEIKLPFFRTYILLDIAWKNRTFQCRVVELLYLHYYCKQNASRAIHLWCGVLLYFSNNSHFKPKHHKISIALACENSRPSSLPARVAFRKKDVCDLPPKIPYWWRKSVPNLVMSADWFDR